MSQESGTAERVYNRLKAAVLVGSLTPHARLDVAELADRFEVSTTPVREAAMRLLGEGLLEAHPGGGTRPALVTEFRLRTLLQLNERMALACVDWAVRPPNPEALAAEDRPYEERVRRAFREIAAMAENSELQDVVERLSDRLAPFRYREEQLIPDPAAELASLEQTIDEPISLRRTLRSYHRRRGKLVPQLVWMANLQASG